MVSTQKVSGKGSVSRTVVRALLVCAGCVGIMLPAWLPNKPGALLERGTVEFLQASLLMASCTVILGASSHAGANRPVCRVLGLFLAAAVVGEIEDFCYSILRIKLPEGWIIGGILAVALGIGIQHRKVVARFCATLGNHAGAGFIGAALLILYVFNRVIGTSPFWKASLGIAFSPEIPKICKSYLELLACYLVFIGTLGLAISLARRSEPS